MPKIRVLVVDDAVVIRKVVTEVLSADPAVEVMGTAANGLIALEKIRLQRPDAVVLDIEMPEMDGLTALKEIRKLHPKLPVVMFSTLTERGASATLDALSLGANDYVTKPSNTGSLDQARVRIQEDLIPKLRALCGVGDKPKATGVQAPIRPAAARTVAPGPVDIVAIGVSTGGPNALGVLIPSLPAELPVPVVIVQHMPPVFTKLLADRLGAKAKVKVREVQGGEVLGPGTVYIAPGNFHMVVVRDGKQVRLKTNQDPPENSCRPAVDPLFRSVAASHGPRALGVILTGMGQDGLQGVRAMRAAGARILAQDEQSSVVWGMPGFVVRDGLADKVLPIDGMAKEVVGLVQADRLPRIFRSNLPTRT